MRPERRLLLTRRSFGLGVTASVAATPAFADPTLDARFKAIEARTGGRLGVHARVDDRFGRNSIGWRADERFLMCSTFKMLAVAAVLARLVRREEHLDRWIKYDASDLQEYAPVARANLDKGGMTLEAICAAAIEVSDNTCANLILDSLGGPKGVTSYIRSLGDQVTRLDRNEPSLNRPGPTGDLHDTTTPRSMSGLWQNILFDNRMKLASSPLLSIQSVAQLRGWLEACSTSPNRLKAATPAGWSIGHKTGLGSTTAGDVAFCNRSDSWPILIAVYLEAPGMLDNSHDDAFAEVGQIVLNALTPVAAMRTPVRG
jgi:beta-lactamase class A